MEADKKVMWVSLALILMGVLILSFIIILVCYEKEEQSTQNPITQVVNSYNTQNTYVTYNIINVVQTVQQVSLVGKDNHYNYVYNKEIDCTNTDYRFYSGQERQERIFGSSIQEYYVYVLNKERIGRYFTVVFELEDKTGEEYSQSVTKYIRAGEKMKFSYRDVQFERNEIVDWDYEVIPEDF